MRELQQARCRTGRPRVLAAQPHAGKAPARLQPVRRPPLWNSQLPLTGKPCLSSCPTAGGGHDGQHAAPPHRSVPGAVHLPALPGDRWAWHLRTADVQASVAISRRANPRSCCCSRPVFILLARLATHLAPRTNRPYCVPSPCRALLPRLAVRCAAQRGAAARAGGSADLAAAPPHGGRGCPRHPLPALPFPPDAAPGYKVAQPGAQPGPLEGGHSRRRQHRQMLHISSPPWAAIQGLAVRVCLV